MTDEEIGKMINESIISLNKTLEDQKIYKELNPSVNPDDITKLIFPNFVKIFNLPEDGLPLPLLPDRDILYTDGLILTNKETGSNTGEVDPHLIQPITKYVDGEETISRLETSTGKSDFIKKQSIIIKNNQNKSGTDQNLFLLTGNSGLTNSKTDSFNFGNVDYIHDILSAITVDGKVDLLLNGEELFNSPIYNLSEIKNGFVVVEPRYIGRSIPTPTLDTKSDDGRIVTNFNTFDLFRFTDVNNIAGDITIKAINSTGKLIGGDIVIKSEGKQINTSGLTYTNDALFTNIITPASQVLSIIRSGDSVRFEDTVPTTNPKNPFNIDSGLEPSPGAFKTFEVEADDSNMLAKHLPSSLVSEDNKKFIETQIGIIRSGNEITINRPKNTTTEEEPSGNELPAKLEIIPKYYADKEVITYKLENGKSTGEIEKIKYITPTIAFNADVDDNNTRFDPYESDGSGTNKQLNFNESGNITTIKKSEFHSKITNKYDILFHQKYGGIKPDPSKLDFGMGKLIIIRNASESADAKENWIYNIPFQFSPELTGESRSANWASHTSLGRTNDYFIWTSTSSRTMQLRASYAIISPDTNDPEWFQKKTKDEKGKDINPINNIYGEWGKYWTEKRMSTILSDYRKLLLPENYTPNTALSDGNRLSPPIIIISFGTAQDTKFSDSITSKTRWLVSDLNIDTRAEAGWTSSKNPRMYEISLTLKEVAPSWRSFQTHAQINGE